MATSQEIFERAELIVKVKEPQSSEWPLIRSGQALFTYFHFAADRELTEAMASTQATCIAYETLQDRNGLLPLLTPMSEVAGRMSIQEGAKYPSRRHSLPSTDPNTGRSLSPDQSPLRWQGRARRRRLL
jgi:alanine dehydrogenase